MHFAVHYFDCPAISSLVMSWSLQAAQSGTLTAIWTQSLAGAHQAPRGGPQEVSRLPTP